MNYPLAYATILQLKPENTSSSHAPIIITTHTTLVIGTFFSNFWSTTHLHLLLTTGHPPTLPLLLLLSNICSPFLPQSFHIHFSYTLETIHVLSLYTTLSLLNSLLYVSSSHVKAAMVCFWAPRYKLMIKKKLHCVTHLSHHLTFDDSELPLLTSCRYLGAPSSCTGATGARIKIWSLPFRLSIIHIWKSNS
jgi:hypothetical protein